MQQEPDDMMYENMENNTLSSPIKKAKFNSNHGIVLDIPDYEPKLVSIKSISFGRHLGILRVGLFFVLILLGCALGVISFLLRQTEINQFNAVFVTSSDQVSIVVDNNLKTKLLTGVAVNNILANAINSGFIGVPPKVTLPGFDQIMGSLCDLSSSRLIAFLPLLTNNTRSDWEEYAREHVNELQGPSCLKERVSKGIFTVCLNGTFVRAPDGHSDSIYPHVLTPVWQNAPIKYTASAIMFDAHSDPIRRPMIDRVIATGKPGFTDILKLVVDNAERPATILYTPVVLQSGGPVVGLTSVVLMWDTVLAAALPKYVSGVTCVVSTPTQAFTYLIQSGATKLVGTGDLHDHKFDSYKRCVTASVTALASISDSDYTITLYPTEDLFDQYITLTPIAVGAATIGMVLFMGAVLAMYEYSLRNKDRRLEGVVETTTRLTSLTLNQLENRNRFVRYISSKIRTPLSAMRLNLDALLAEVLALEAKGQLVRAVQQLSGLCDHALEVMASLQLFDQVCSDSLQLNMTPLNVFDLVEEVFQTCRLQATDAQLELQLENDLSLDDMETEANILGDRDKLALCLRHVLRNAIRFSDPGTAVIVRVRRVDSVSVFERAHRFVIDVVDSGPGIPLAKQNKLFQDLFDVDSPPQNPSESSGSTASGLGIFIVHGILRQHGGSIRMCSEGEGRGCRVSLELPMVAQPREEYRIVAENILLDLPALGFPTISTVDMEIHGATDTPVDFGEHRLAQSVDAAPSPARTVRVLVVEGTGSGNRRRELAMLIRGLHKDYQSALRDVDRSSLGSSFPGLSPEPRYECDEARSATEAVSFVKKLRRNPGATQSDGGYVAILVLHDDDYDDDDENSSACDCIRAIRELGHEGVILGVVDGDEGGAAWRSLLDSGADETVPYPMSPGAFAAKMESICLLGACPVSQAATR